MKSFLISDNFFCLAKLQGDDLIELQLRGTATTDATLTAIGRWKKLRILGLRNTKITNAGLEALDGLSALDSLTMRAAIDSSLAPPLPASREGAAPSATMPGPPRVPSDIAQLASERASSPGKPAALRAKSGPPPDRTILIWLGIGCVVLVVVYLALSWRK